MIRAHVLALLLAALAPAAPQHPLQGDLDGLAGWCRDVGLEKERAGLLEALLLLAPDHETARRDLGYRRRAGGPWERDSSWQAPRQSARKMRRELRKRQHALVGRHLKSLDPSLPRRTRRSVLLSLQHLAPRDQRIRKALGERRSGGRWVLRESVTARARRRALEKKLAEIRRKVRPPKNGTLEPNERKVPVPWSGIRTAPTVRVAGTVPQKEIEATAQLAGVTEALYAFAIDPTPASFPEYRIYLLAGKQEQSAWLAHHPLMTDSRRQFQQNLLCGWVPSTWHVAIWPPSPVRRAEWACRQTIWLHMQRRYGLSLFTHGVFAEGIGLYLGHMITGERASWFVTPSSYQQSGSDLAEKLRDGEFDWMAEARNQVKAKKAPDYHTLLARGVNTMTAQDLLHAYALAAFLIEGEVEGLPELLSTLGRGKPVREALPETIGLSVRELQERVFRWLTEAKRRRR